MLQGFVSNKDSELGEDKGDPLEAVLYAVFVATSSRASVSELAVMLSVDQSRLLAAVSVACRLGFAIRLPTQGPARFQSHRPKVWFSLSQECRSPGRNPSQSCHLDTCALIVL